MFQDNTILLLQAGALVWIKTFREKFAYEEKFIRGKVSFTAKTIMCQLLNGISKAVVLIYLPDFTNAITLFKFLLYSLTNLGGHYCYTFSISYLKNHSHVSVLFVCYH